jgi:uncharacterized membrane-anchored protein
MSWPPQIEWRPGPAHVAAGAAAALELPAGYVAAGRAQARIFLDATGNPPAGNEVLVCGPETLDWFAVFSFDGYDALGFVGREGPPDVEAIAKAIRSGNEEANRRRGEARRTELLLGGWREAPHYDAATHNLEWSLDTRETDGREVANHFTFYLSRDGVMTVEMVSNPQEFEAHRAQFRQLLRGFRFLPGQEYTPPAPQSFDWRWAALALVMLPAWWVFRRGRLAKRTAT